MRWIRLLFFCAACAAAHSEPAVRELTVPPGYAAFRAAGLHELANGTAVVGSGRTPAGSWRPLLVFLSPEFEYRGHREIETDGSQLVAASVRTEQGLGLLTNVRSGQGDSAAAPQGMRVSAIDPEGRLLWSSEFGGAGFGNAGALAVDPGSGTLAALGWVDDSGGDLESHHGGWDVVVGLFAPGGTLRWQTVLGSGEDEIGGKVLVTSEEAYVLYNGWDPKAQWDVVMTRIDAASGSTGRQRTIRGRGADAVADLQLLANGNLLVLATTASEGRWWGDSKGKTDIVLLELNQRGGVVRSQRFGWSESEFGHQLLDLGDAGWAVVGVTDSPTAAGTEAVGGFDILVLSLDRSGVLLRTQRAGTLENDWPVAGRVTDGGIEVLARTQPKAGDGTSFVVRFER